MRNCHIFFCVLPHTVDYNVQCHYNVTVFKKKTIKSFPINIRNKGKEPININKRIKVNKLKLFLSNIISFMGSHF